MLLSISTEYCWAPGGDMWPDLRLQSYRLASPIFSANQVMPGTQLARPQLRYPHVPAHLSLARVRPQVTLK